MQVHTPQKRLKRLSNSFIGSFNTFDISTTLNHAKPLWSKWARGSEGPLWISVKYYRMGSSTTFSVSANSLWSGNLSSTIWMFLVCYWISKYRHTFQLVNCLADFFLKFWFLILEKFWSYLIELILMLIIKRTLLRNSFSQLFILIVINPKSNGCVIKGISKIYHTTGRDHRMVSTKKDEDRIERTWHWILLCK